MNSFRNVERAIDFEIERQIEIVEDGGKITQQTLLWNADINEAFPMRSKEEAHDYRYFPDPDLLPIIVDENWKSEIRKSLPELADARKERFVNDFKLPAYDADLLTSEKSLADYYEEVLTVTKDYKSASNWVMGDVLKYINDENISPKEFPVSPKNLGKLIELINNNTISGKIAKEVFPEMLKNNSDPEIIVKEKNLVQITDTSAIEGIIDNILTAYEKQIQQYLDGKESVLGFFVGQIMKESKGKANPGMVNQLLKKKLEELRN